MTAPVDVLVIVLKQSVSLERALLSHCCNFALVAIEAFGKDVTRVGWLNSELFCPIQKAGFRFFFKAVFFSAYGNIPFSGCFGGTHNQGGDLGEKGAVRNIDAGGRLYSFLRRWVNICN